MQLLVVAKRLSRCLCKETIITAFDDNGGPWFALGQSLTSVCSDPKGNKKLQSQLTDLVNTTQQQIAKATQQQAQPQQNQQSQVQTQNTGKTSFPEAVGTLRAFHRRSLHMPTPQPGIDEELQTQKKGFRRSTRCSSDRTRRIL